MEPVLLSHRVEGDPTGLPVVMIHPLGADQTFWDRCRQHFGPGILTVSCDLRGSGASADLCKPLMLQTTVDDIEHLRRYLDLDRIVVAGCAVGAMAAALYASRHQANTSALVMSNPGFRITKAGRTNLTERAAQVRMSGMLSLLPQAIENAFIGYAETEARRHYENAFVRQKPENYAYAALGAAEADISDVIAQISCPILLTPGRNDRLFPSEQHASEIIAKAPTATVVAFPQGAHFIPYQQGEAFGATVSNFLDGLGLRPHS